MSLIPKDMTPGLQGDDRQGHRARDDGSGRSTSTCFRRATTRAPRARTSRRGSVSRRPAATKRRGASTWRKTRCRERTGAPAITRARAPATVRQLDQPVSIHSLDRFLGDLANEKGWDGRAGRADRQARSRRRRGPWRPVVCLSPEAHGPRRRNPRREPGAGRDDALRHSAVPAAARGPRAGDRTHPGDGRGDHLQLPGRRRARGKGGRPLRRGVPGGRRPGRQSSRHSVDGRRPDDPRARRAGAGRARAAPPSSAASSGSSAPATRRWTPRASPGDWVPRKRS